ncbi:MAG: hypothetical protein QXU42_03740 [Thermoproteota archaeon]
MRLKLWSVPLFFSLLALIIPVETDLVFYPSNKGEWISPGDFAEYVVSDIAFYNETHFISNFWNQTGTLRWQVLSKFDDIVELEVSLNVSGEVVTQAKEEEPPLSKITVSKRLVLTVNVSSREAKYMGKDIGYIPFWIGKMPSKGQRIPMFRHGDEMLYGEVFSVSEDTDWFGKKTRLVILEIFNPDQNDFIYLVNLYDWYSGLALSLVDQGGSPENPGEVRIGTLNGTSIEVFKFGGTPLGKLLDLGFSCYFVLNSTSIRIGPPLEEGGLDVELITAVGFFAASGIFIAYVLLRQRLKPGGE